MWPHRRSAARGSRVQTLATSPTGCSNVNRTNWRSLSQKRYTIEIVSRTLKCSLDTAKRGFYRAANSIFGKIWRIASDEVVLQLIKSKCVPVLLYGLEACALNNSHMASLDFVVNRFLMKLFNTNNIDTVKACQEFFSFELPSVELAKRVVKFKSKVNTV